MSRTAIELIKRFEGYRRKAAQLPDGRWTIGYGHTLTARQGAEVSEADAEALLIYDLLAVTGAVREHVHAPLNRNQSDALSAFAFNIGLENFARSGVLLRLNEGSPILAACAMELWRKAEVGGETIVVDALVRRRAAEKALFLTPDGEAWPTAPSHLLQPLQDLAAHDLVPCETPVEVAARESDDAVVAERVGEPVPLPVVPDEEDGPMRTAAEAITARLSTIFQEDPAEAVVAPPAEEPPPEPVAAEPPPFVLEPPEFDDTELGDDDAPEIEPEIETAPGPDLFTPSAEAAEAEVATEPEAAAEEEEEAADGPAWPGPRDPEERRIIDDAVPFDFEDEPAAEPEPEPTEGGALTLVALAVIGLVFFGGGVFWATNARPAPERAWVEPTMVGWLAGVTGALFFAVAVYLLLLRLGRAQERAAREGR
jgi:lysozyme